MFSKARPSCTKKRQVRRPGSPAITAAPVGRKRCHLVRAAHRICLAILAIAVACGWSFATPATPQIERLTLPNGLTVVVAELPSLDVAHVSIFYHVAEKDMRTGESGHAHLFEHLAFSRTRDIPQTLWKFLKELGATDFDANSRHDYTNYFATVPPPKLDRLLWMESQRMGHLAGTLAEEDLVRSRKEVEDEERKLVQIPWFRMLLATWDQTYPSSHPYAARGIYTDDVQSATLEDARRFYSRYYHPANAVLVVVGPVEKAEVRQSVHRHFGELKGGSPRRRSDLSLRSRRLAVWRPRALAPNRPFASYGTSPHGATRKRFTWNSVAL
jgi:zinc protease